MLTQKQIVLLCALMRTKVKTGLWFREETIEFESGEFLYCYPSGLLIFEDRPVNHLEQTQNFQVLTDYLLKTRWGLRDPSERVEI